MIKRIAKRGVGLILAGIMTAGVVLPSCSKKKPQEIVTPRPLPTTPMLSSPPNRATKEALNPIFRWSGDYQYYFTLQISMDSTFQCSTVTESLAAYDYFSADLRKSTTYYWRVKATNPGGSSGWSSVWSFTTGPVELVATLKTPGYALAVAVESSYCYLVSDSGLWVIDITNPTSPTLNGNYHIGLASSPSPQIMLRGSYAYLSTGSGLSIFDVSNPVSPNRIVQTTYGMGSNDMTVEGNYAYLCLSRAMNIIDISNPAAPTFSGVWYLPGSCAWKGPCEVITSVTVIDNYTYLSTSYNLNIIDVSNPTAPDSVGSLSGVSGNLERAGNFLYSSGSLIDITNRSSPKIETSYPPLGELLSIWNSFGAWGLWEGYSSSNYQYKIRIADIANSQPPALMGQYNILVRYLGNDNLISGNSNLVFVAAGNDGLKILKMSP